MEIERFLRLVEIVHKELQLLSMFLIAITAGFLLLTIVMWLDLRSILKERKYNGTADNRRSEDE